jgi:hypothetical protein
MTDRSVPEDRIKTLSVRIATKGLPDTTPEDIIRRRACHQMGHAIAEKLFEFTKVSRTPGANKGEIIFTASLDVIVPETPEENKEQAREK